LALLGGAPVGVEDSSRVATEQR
jgi:hypothetical protein